MKYDAIQEWIDCVETIEKHYIDNKAYYCFYHSPWSFHIPTDIPDKNIDFSETKVLHDFNSSRYTHDVTFDEKTALEYLFESHDFNPNKYLPSDATSNVYWPYLPQNNNQFSLSVSPHSMSNSNTL